MEICQGGSAPLIVLDEPSEASGPGEGTLVDLASGQENKAALGLRQFDDVHFDAVRPGRRWRLLALLALVHEGDLRALIRGGLNGLGRSSDLGSIVGVRGREVQ